MEVKTLLALGSLGAFILVLAALFVIPIPKGNEQLLNTSIMALIALVTTVGAYFFGYSEGQKTPKPPEIPAPTKEAQ